MNHEIDQYLEIEQISQIREKCQPAEIWGHIFFCGEGFQLYFLQLLRQIRSLDELEWFEQS